MNKHLLITNDYPPKIGGIQQYLWELWRRLEPGLVKVITTPYRGANDFDAAQSHQIVRSREPVLLPYPWLARRLNEAGREFGAQLNVIDPAVPLGLIGPSLDLPYAVVLHGAEVTIPGRLPVGRHALARVLGNATAVVSAGRYALDEAERAVGHPLRSVVVPPGVDVDRFRPTGTADQLAIRRRYDIPAAAPFIFSVSRLVPRKGMDTLVAVASRLRRQFPDLVVAIAGSGREERRLVSKINALGAPVRLLGRIPDDDVAQLYAAADLFSMLCRSRWGGLEQEGFGIVFLEAAAAGTAQIARASGGVAEAVVDGETGVVVANDASVGEIAEIFAAVLEDDARRHDMAAASRSRAVDQFSYDVLAARLGDALNEWMS